MLSSNYIKDYEFKKGIGYSRRSVDEFVAKITGDYDAVCKENIELKDKINALSEGLQYYKSIEKTLQKALVLAQKASDEEQENATKKARIIEKTAHTKADEVLTKAKSDLDSIFRQTDDLNRRFELYKAHVKNLITTQLDLMNSDAYNISVNDLEGYLKLKEQLEDAKQIEPEDVEKMQEVNKMSEDNQDDIKAADKDEKNSETEHNEAISNETNIKKEEEAERTDEKISFDETDKDEKIPDFHKEKHTSIRENLINRIPSETVKKDEVNSDLQSENQNVKASIKRIPASNIYRNGESEYGQNT